MVLLENMYYEDAMDMIELEQYPGNVALSSTKKNPLSVNIANESGTYYMASSDLEQYMEASHEIDAKKAIDAVAEAHKISTDNIVVVVDEACEFVLETLSEAGVMLEKAAEAGSTNLKKTMKWYNKFISKSKSVDKNTTVHQVQARIKVLEECVAKMKNAKKDFESNKSIGNALKYELKSIIPFNSIYRLIKLQDTYAGVGVLKDILLTFVVAGEALSGVNMHLARKNLRKSDDRDDRDQFGKDMARFGRAVRFSKDRLNKDYKAAQGSNLAMGADMIIRGTNYARMLQAQIDKTQEAIDFLKEKVKELQKQK